MKQLYTISLLLLVSFPLLGQELKGKASYVTDGDTFHFISDNGEKYKVRLADIDAPESTQPYGLEAKQQLIKYIKGRVVTIKNTDRYGRKIAYVYKGETDIGLRMINDGLAWWYEYYAKDNAAYKEAEEEARKQNRGLWQDPNPINPYDWRKNH